MLEKTCSHTYVEPKIDRTPNAYFFYVYISVGDGIPCFEYKFVLFGKVFNITPFKILSQNGLLTGNILKSSGQAFELGHPYIFVGYIGQLHLKIRLTYTCKCSHIQ